MNLTREQVDSARAGEPVRAVDPETQTELVVLRADVYERLKSLLEDFDPRETYEAFRQAAGDEWDDPALDVYEQYR